MPIKSADVYGRRFVKDAPPGELEVASGDVGPPDVKPTMVFVGLILALIALRIAYEQA